MGKNREKARVGVIYSHVIRTVFYYLSLHLPWRFLDCGWKEVCRQIEVCGAGASVKGLWSPLLSLHSSNLNKKYFAICRGILSRVKRGKILN